MAVALGLFNLDVHGVMGHCITDIGLCTVCNEVICYAMKCLTFSGAYLVTASTFKQPHNGNRAKTAAVTSMTARKWSEDCVLWRSRLCICVL